MAVTSTNNLKIGSSGDDVLDLQKRLNATGYGYNLDEDGIFGNNTLAAVKDYQQRSGLDVDGIVGTNTWGSLTNGGSSSSASSSETTTAPTETKDPSFEYGAYEKSDVVKEAEALLQQQLANKPGEYTSAWQTQLNETLDKILNREKFSYDLNGDALYQQYKDQYTTQGKMAMMDTMGQAAAMTGGYGNSYAQSVGQQAYQGYLQQLNDRIPELYQLALDQYNREGDEMYNQASLMASMEDQDYGRYRDQLTDYNAELDRLTEDARYQGELDYSKWADDRNFNYSQYIDDRNLAYQTERDKIADEQWQAQFDEAIRQYNHANGIKTGSTGDTTDTDSPTSPKKGYDNGTKKESEIEAMQNYLGLSGDGKWGPNSQAAAKAKWGVTSADEAWAKYQAAIAGGNTGGFTGSTYEEAVAYMKSKGVSGAANVMTKSEWTRRKASYNATGVGGSEVIYNGTYQDYLRSYVEYKVNPNG